MNKNELAEAVASREGMPPEHATRVVDALFETLFETLQAGERVTLRGVGSFTVTTRKARKGTNPQTGEEIQLPATRSVKFKPAKSLREALEQQEPAAEQAPAAPEPEATAAPKQEPAAGQQEEAAATPEQQVAAPAPEPEVGKRQEGAMESEQGRRQHSRKQVEIPVEYFLLDKFISDYTHNISQGGLFIRSEQHLDQGTELLFKLTVPRLDEPLTVSGRVAWVRTAEQAARTGKEPGMGVQFVYGSEAERREVEQIVQALLEGRDEAVTDARRASPRVPVELKVEYQNLDTFITEYARNISKGGVFIHTEQQLEVGTELLFKLHVPRLPEPLQLRGRVAWVRRVEEAGPARRPGMGIRFVYDSDDERLRLERTVESLSQQA